MINNTRFPSNPIEMYKSYGFAILKVFDKEQCKVLDQFSRSWIYKLLSKWTKGKEKEYPLEEYHIWSKKLSGDHENTFRAKNRYSSPGKDIEDILINNKVKDFLKNIGFDSFEKWDEGLGWLGFRFIRPSANDGYPLSRKAWGPAKKVVSCWIPIIGYNSKETLTLVSGSHLKEYKKYLPTENNKFTPNEYRYAGDINELEFYNPTLKKGEVIFFHPKTLHSEDVIDSDITRLNLEVRFDKI